MQIDEDGQEVEDPDKPPLPAFPKYEGLIFTVEVLPNKAPADPIFPPAVGLVEVPGGQQGVPLSGSTAAFTAGTGLVPPPPVAAVH